MTLWGNTIANDQLFSKQHEAWKQVEQLAWLCPAWKTYTSQLLNLCCAQSWLRKDKVVAGNSMAVFSWTILPGWQQYPKRTEPPACYRSNILSARWAQGGKLFHQSVHCLREKTFLPHLVLTCNLYAQNNIKTFYAPWKTPCLLMCQPWPTHLYVKIRSGTTDLVQAVYTSKGQSDVPLHHIIYSWSWFHCHSFCYIKLDTLRFF